jgi:hypothetical protein
MKKKFFMLQVEKQFVVRFTVVILLAIMLFLPGKSYAASVSAVIDCNNELCDISPYIFGHNTSSVYYKAPMTDPSMLDKIRRMGLRMHRFFPGAAGQRYDFKYNNYKGKYWSGGSPTEPWRSEPADAVPSVEDELRFCNAVGAEPFIEVNTAFCGPNGTHYDAGGGWTGGMDFHPVYYTVGNETGWDSQPYDHYLDCCRAYSPAMKARDPNISVSFSCIGVTPLGDITDMYDIHAYPTNNSTLATYVFCAGELDGSYLSINHTNTIGNILNSYANNFPGIDPIISISEWGDNSYQVEQFHFFEYIGGIFTAHMFYRCVKNKIFATCAWSMWKENPGTWDYQMFGPAPDHKERPRYFTYVMYKHFGNRLLECYDPREYTPGVTDFFTEYKDDWDELLVQASKRSDGSIAVMAINLSDTETYDTQISLANFDMGGVVEVHTMNNSNCYEGGPGPSLSTLTGQSSPINYTFAPLTVTCLVVRQTGWEPDVPVITNVASGNITETGATITWDTDKASTSQVEYGPTTSYGNSTFEDSNLVTSHSVNLTGLTLGTEYHYRVICKDSENKESMSVDYKFMTAGGTPGGGIDVKAYPNPVSGGGQITFSVGGATGGEVKIYTINGKLVKELVIQSGASEVDWDVLNEDGNSITTGLYLYTVTDGDGNKKTGKLAITQ